MRAGVRARMARSKDGESGVIGAGGIGGGARGRQADREGHGLRVAGIERADLGHDLQVDQTAIEHGRRKGEADAVFLVVDGDRAERTGNRHGKLAAGEKARLLSVHCYQVGFSQVAEGTLRSQDAKHC